MITPSLPIVKGKSLKNKPYAYDNPLTERQDTSKVQYRAECTTRDDALGSQICYKLLKIILFLHDSRKSLICIKDIPDKIGNSNIPLISFHVLLIFMPQGLGSIRDRTNPQTVFTLSFTHARLQ